MAFVCVRVYVCVCMCVRVCVCVSSLYKSMSRKFWFKFLFNILTLPRMGHFSLSTFSSAATLQLTLSVLCLRIVYERLKKV